MADPKLSYIRMDGTTLAINDAATATTVNKQTNIIAGLQTSLNGTDITIGGQTIHTKGLKEKVSDLESEMDTAQADITANQASISTLATTVASNKTETDNQFANIQKKLMYVNVLSYGADPTGETDCATAFANAIAATPAHGTCYIPNGEYRLNSTISITKPMTLLGDYFGLDVEEYNLNDGTTARAPLIHAYTDNTPVIQIQSQGVKLQGLGIRAHTAGSGIKVLNGSGTSTVARNIMLDSVFIDGSKDDGSYLSVGFSADQLITSDFRFCRFIFVANGFLIGKAGGASTSLHFDNCWVESFTSVGYQLVSCHYSAFTACAADGNKWVSPDYAYALVDCDSITYTGCGCENIGTCGIQLNTSTAITVMGHLFTTTPIGVRYGGNSQATMIGCIVMGENSLATVIDTYNIIGCTYTKFTDNGTVITTANGNYIKPALT